MIPTAHVAQLTCKKRHALLRESAIFAKIQQIYLPFNFNCIIIIIIQKPQIFKYILRFFLISSRRYDMSSSFFPMGQLFALSRDPIVCCRENQIVFMNMPAIALAPGSPFRIFCRNLCF